MTTTSPAAPVTAAAPLPARRRAAFAGLLLAEWTKIRSVRSTVWTLISFVVLTIGLTAGITALVVSNWDKPGSHEGQLRIIAAPVGFILGAGIGFGQLTICVLGVLVITSEYSTGVIRASLLAVPRRIPMLIAKLVVLAARLLVLSEIVAFGSFFLGSLLLFIKVIVTMRDLVGTAV